MRLSIDTSADRSTDTSVDRSLPRRRSAEADAVRRPLALGVMVASGFAGLGYQIVWTQQNTVWLGHEAAAVLAVVTAFFGGLALGALALSPRIERCLRPARWYAACEALVGVWSVALALLMAPVGSAMLTLTGVQPTPVWQWAVAFGGTFLLLLPATAAMGATLPAMERVLAHWGRLDKSGRLHKSGRSGHPGRTIAGLYACNTLGAVLGVLACAFWLVPAIGLAGTAGVCAVLNGLCAVAALALGAGARPPSAPAMPLPRPLAVGLVAPGLTGQRCLALLALTGLLGIGYEVLVVRVISQVAENTVYTFAMLLAVYLLGSAAGAAAYQRWLAKVGQPTTTPCTDPSTDRSTDRSTVHTSDTLLALLAAACLLGTASLWWADAIGDVVSLRLGAGMASALAAEATVALAAFGLPTVLMGALFSHLSSQAQAAGIGFGRSLGVNTLGAAAAPLLFGVVLLPLLGAKAALLLLAGAYLLLLSPYAWRRRGVWAPALAVLALALWAPPLVFVDLPEGGRVVSYQEGAMAAVSVVQDADGVSRLHIDNRQQEGSSSSLLADARQALLPLLLHPAPQRALLLGLGTGMTASTAASDPTLQVDAVELLPEVIRASAHFTRALNGGAANPRLQLIAADARRFVRSGGQPYDLIVADNFHPARSGSGALYTVEHFRAVQARLAQDGLFCQWLPLHQLDLDTLRSIVQSFVAVYPGAWAMLATNSLDTPVLGLVARHGAGGFDLALLRQRLASARLPQPLGDFGLADEFALLGGFVAGPVSLRRFAGDAPLNTDDHPVVAYRAPRITYAPDSLPRERLLSLLGSLQIAAADLLDATPDVEGARRLAAYWAARDRFIEVGRTVQPSADVQKMLAQVGEPLLAVLRISPDFRPAYDPLLRMANALARTDPAGARALFSALKQAQPARPEAALALDRLTGLPH